MHFARYFSSSLRLGGLLVCAAALSFCPGCETNSGTDSSGSEGDTSPAFYLSPSAATLYQGETSLSFTAVGGNPPFSWSVSDPAKGTVPDTDAAAVTYTSAGAGTGVNTIEVVDSRGWEAHATVTHSDDVTTAVQVTPSSVTLSGATISATFTASQGNPPYFWSTDAPALGTITPVGSSDGSQAFYVRTAALGTATLTVIDSYGRGAAAIVIQE